MGMVEPLDPSLAKPWAILLPHPDDMAPRLFPLLDVGFWKEGFLDAPVDN